MTHIERRIAGLQHRPAGDSVDVKGCTRTFVALLVHCMMWSDPPQAPWPLGPACSTGLTWLIDDRRGLQSCSNTRGECCVSLTVSDRRCLDHQLEKSWQMEPVQRRGWANRIDRELAAESFTIKKSITIASSCCKVQTRMLSEEFVAKPHQTLIPLAGHHGLQVSKCEVNPCAARQKLCTALSVASLQTG